MNRPVSILLCAFLTLGGLGSRPGFGQREEPSRPAKRPSGKAAVRERAPQAGTPSDRDEETTSAAARRRRRRAAPISPPPAAPKPAGKAADQDKEKEKDAAKPKAAAGAEPGEKPAEPGAAPGEKEFNECVKIPSRRRIKITLKPESDLNDLVAWISSMTCRRFVIASNLATQKVTLVSPTPVTAQEAYRAFLSALDVMGLTVVPTGRYLKIVQGNWAIQSSIPTYGDDTRDQLPATDAVVTQLVRAQNVDVNELLLVLNKMKSRNGDVTAYKPTNTLILTDAGNNVRRMLRIVKELDVPVAGEKIWVVRLRNADAEEVKKILDQIFTGRTTSPLPMMRLNVERGSGAAGQPQTPHHEDVGSLSASKIITEPLTNSLIIVASPSSFGRIASLIKKLDVESDGVSQRIHVYYLENGDAEQMANTISAVTGGAQGRRTTPAGAGAAPGARGPVTGLFEGDVRVSADKPTNSLVVVASSKDYLNLRAVIRKLDVARKQVFVEASIMEINVDKARKLGFAYHGGGITGEGKTQSLIFGGVQHSDWSSLAINPLALMGLSVGARGALVDGSAELLGLQADIPGFGVMFQALQTGSNVNVLSSPHILTTENEEAEISVGQNIPFQGAFMGGGFGALAGAAGQAGGLGSLLPAVSVQRQDVALKLKLTPYVNENDVVRMKIEQEVSDIASPNFNNLGPSTSKRTAKTTVVVRDQQTVVIGGLMRDKVDNTESKVPLLGDIPILGYLFRHSARTMQKTSLMIILTPYIIRDQSDLRRIFKKKLEERREFIERYTSFKHTDPARDIDFRHKHGLLSEINRVGDQAEQDSRLIKDAQKRLQEHSDPVDAPPSAPPSGTAPPPGAGDRAPGGEGAAEGGDRRAPPAPVNPMTPPR
ncbi:MAG: type II secretion system secretin GspD [Deltaproteobacteria bacterium]|nr:type II secretion system secretin GspD [Deltaproteobacteria bacterium]